MANAFPDLNTEIGLKALDDYLRRKSFINGEEITNADLEFYAVVDKPSSESHPNAGKWYGAVTEKLVSRKGDWESIGGQTADVESAAPGADSKNAGQDSAAKGDDVPDPTEEEKTDAEESEAFKAAEAFLCGEARTIKMSMTIPWDDEDGEEKKKKLQEGVKNLRIKGLSWTPSLRTNSVTMPKYKDDPRAVCVYTVCDESKYLIVRNVPSLGCGDELLKLFSTYGPVDGCKPMDAEDCEPYTDVYWIKFHQINNARFAKRKLDDSIFLGNRIQITYASHYESLIDTKEKLEGRRKEVLTRLNPRKFKGPPASNSEPPSVSNTFTHATIILPTEIKKSQTNAPAHTFPKEPVALNKEYFPIESMNQTVHMVREKLNKIQSSVEQLGSSKRARSDNRRRI